VLTGVWVQVNQLGAKGRGVAVEKEAGDGDVVRTSDRWWWGNPAREDDMLGSMVSQRVRCRVCGRPALIMRT